MEFEKLEAGRYRSSCNEYEIRKGKGRWYVWTPPSTIIFRARTFKDAKLQLERLTGQILPASIRPLRKSIPGHYLSDCGQFCFTLTANGWHPMSTVSGYETVELRIAYLAFHGLDEFFPTLKEAVERLEEAVTVDPVERLVEKQWPD